MSDVYLSTLVGVTFHSAPSCSSFSARYAYYLCDNDKLDCTHACLPLSSEWHTLCVTLK